MIDLLKGVFRANIHHLFVCIPFKKPIFIYSSRRGGSTILAQSISAMGTCRYIDQPFTYHLFPNHKSGKVRQKFIPKRKYRSIISMNDQELSKLLKYLSTFLKGDFAFFDNKYLYYLYKGGQSFKSILACFFTNRILLKIADGLALIDLLTEKFKPINVYLLRHPCAQALSVVKNQWGLTAMSYLEDELFAKRLTPQQLSLAYEIMEGKNPFHKAVVNWFLENFVLLRTSTPYLLVHYEYLISDTYNQLIRIKNYTHSSGSLKKGLQVYEHPSYSSHMSTDESKEAIQKSKIDYLLRKWMEEVDVSDPVLHRIFEVFESRHYAPLAIMPLE